jgi:DNA-binding LacI/PurR family transcriptional regulator
VAGHDDHPLSRFASPPLTTLAQDYVEMANLAVDMLANRDDNPGVKPNENVILLESKLIMRDTA